MDGDCGALLRFALATFAMKQQAAAAASDETLDALGATVDFLRAARAVGGGERDREAEAARVAQLLGGVLSHDAQRAQLLATLVDALASSAEEDEDEDDALLLGEVIVYVCYASYDEDAHPQRDVCAEVCSALTAALANEALAPKQQQAVARVLGDVRALLRVVHTEREW